MVQFWFILFHPLVILIQQFSLIADNDQLCKHPLTVGELLHVRQRAMLRAKCKACLGYTVDDLDGLGQWFSGKKGNHLF